MVTTLVNPPRALRPPFARVAGWVDNTLTLLSEPENQLGTALSHTNLDVKGTCDRFVAFIIMIVTTAIPTCD